MWIEPTTVNSVNSQGRLSLQWEQTWRIILPPITGLFSNTGRLTKHLSLLLSLWYLIIILKNLLPEILGHVADVFSFCELHPWWFARHMSDAVFLTKASVILVLFLQDWKRSRDLATDHQFSWADSCSSNWGSSISE